MLTTHLNPGGVSRYVLNLAKGLVKQGHKVWVASSGGEWASKLEAENIKHLSIPIKTKSIFSIKIFTSFLKLRNMIVNENIDILHCNTRVTQKLGNVIYKSLKVPYVSAFHGYYSSGIFRKIFKYSGLRSIAVSQAVGRHLVQDLSFNIENVRVVHNGLDASDFSSKEAKKQDFGFKNNDFLIGILGRVSQEKGHFLAAQAMSVLAQEYDNVYFLISGKGKLEQKLKALIRQLRIEEKVKFLNIGANKFLDVLDLLLVPSAKEGFGYSIIEAFLKEVPVVGYDVGGISEIITDRKNGIIFYNYTVSALCDAIRELIVKDALRSRLVAAAKEDIWYYSYERMAQDTEKVYREIIS